MTITHSERRERPIIFSGAMVRAILAGRKTQTRRVITPRPEIVDGFKFVVMDGVLHLGSAGIPRKNISFFECRYGRPGDHLWVRENLYPNNEFGCNAGSNAGGIWPYYEADDTPVIDRDHHRILKVTPSIYMPRWASRITLEIVSVRVERLQGISEADAIAEGLSALSKDQGRTWKWGIPDRDGMPGGDDDGWAWKVWDVDPRAAYHRLWDSIYAERGFVWETNPWVWVVEFRRVDQ